MDNQVYYLLTFECDGITQTTQIDDREFQPLVLNGSDDDKAVGVISYDSSLDRYAISGLNEKGEAYFPNKQLESTINRDFFKYPKEIIFKETPEDLMNVEGSVYMDIYHLLQTKSIHTCAYFIMVYN